MVVRRTSCPVRGWWVLGSLSALFGVGCATGNQTPPIEPGCADFDGDHYGEGADCLGPDCSDSVPYAHTEAECDALCDTPDSGPGCSCEGGTSVVCYFGAAGTQTVGACHVGLMRCEDGVYGECEAQVIPRDERCDMQDEDCDGSVDNGVRNACGTCDQVCVEECVGAGCDDPFNPEEEGAHDVALTPEGGLTLDGDAFIRNTYIWIANSAEGTVSKINTRTRIEEGRYRTGPNGPDDNPSRTTVNAIGDAVVSNRGAAGEVSKFLASDCPDLDGDGVVETSTGGSDVYDWQTDECLSWTHPLGVPARGSTFDLLVGLDGVTEERVWVGSTDSHEIHELLATNEPLDHRDTERVLPDVYPYGLAMGPGHVLWTFSNPWTSLVRVETEGGRLDRTDIPILDGERPYGITVDAEGRVWIGETVARYDPAQDLWESPSAVVWGGGIACDAQGNAYVGEYGRGGGPWKIDAETLEATVLPGAGGHGWAVDFDGFIWSIEFNGARAFVTDPDTLQVVFTFDQLVGAYSYSDMTGFQLFNATRPSGVLPLVFEGCDKSVTTNWGHLDWTVSEAPPGTTVAFAVRTSDEAATLMTQPLLELGTAPPLVAPLHLGDALDVAGIEPGALLYLEVRLRSQDPAAAPVLRQVGVAFSCNEVPR